MHNRQKQFEELRGVFERSGFKPVMIDALMGTLEIVAADAFCDGYGRATMDVAHSLLILENKSQEVNEWRNKVIKEQATKNRALLQKMMEDILLKAEDKVVEDKKLDNLPKIDPNNPPDYL